MGAVAPKRMELGMRDSAGILPLLGGTPFYVDGTGCLVRTHAMPEPGKTGRTARRKTLQSESKFDLLCTATRHSTILK